MIHENITYLIYKAQKSLDNLIRMFLNSSLDENSLVLLAGLTKKFITFYQKIFLKGLFLFIDKIDMNINFKEDFQNIDNITSILFKQIDESLKKIHYEKSQEKRQEYINNIVGNLRVLKSLLDEISSLIITIIKYQNGSIKQNQLREKYRSFKFNFKNIIQNI